MLPNYDNLYTFLINFIVVGASSSVAKTLTAPLDRIKLILQNQKSAFHVISGQRKQYLNLYDCWIRIPKEQGFASFWRGNGTNVLRYIPTQALNFACNDLFKSQLSGNRKSENVIIAYIAGGMSGATAVVTMYPLKFCQTRISLDMGSGKKGGPNISREYNGLGDCLKKIIRKEGVLGMYRGISLAIVSAMTYRALYFGLFESLKQSYYSYQKELGDVNFNAKPPLWVEFLFAQIVTICSGLSVYPLDTVGRRYMLDSGRKTNKQVFPGPWKAFKIVYAKEGVVSFYKGGFTNCLRGICGALILVFYDEFLHYTRWKDAIEKSEE